MILLEMIILDIFFYIRVETPSYGFINWMTNFFLII
jgi:hypothetical protein